jgi:hypothetical protein
MSCLLVCTKVTLKNNFFFIQSFRMFWNTVFFNTESSKWSNYSRPKCWTSPWWQDILAYTSPHAKLPHLKNCRIFCRILQLFCPRVSNMHNTCCIVHIWLSKKITPMTIAICTTLLGGFFHLFILFYFYLFYLNLKSRIMI